MKVLLPKFTNNDTLFFVRLLFTTLYGKPTELRLYNIEGRRKEYLVVNVDESKGKQVAVNYMKKLLEPYCYFIKNDYLFKKWLDTGIVEKLGQLEEVDSVFQLKGL